jgi:outer membrane protein insertion porin family
MFTYKIVVIACATFFGFHFSTHSSQSSIPSDKPDEQQKRIRSIVMSGNNFIPEEALRARIPFREGDLFVEAKTGDLIKNLYDLRFFNQVTLEKEDVSPTELDLYVIVQEKKKVENISYEGNRTISSEDIEKELKLSEIAAMDEEELELFAHKIKALYVEKNYHQTTIVTELCPTERGSYIAHFRICEGPRATVKRVLFEGNLCIASHILRKMIFTRESWIFGFMNKAGTYKPDMLDVDKFIIENYYQSNGYLAARVVDVQVDIDQKSQDISVTYTIEEGPLFTVTKISAPGNDILTEAQLLSVLPISAGQLYSKEFVRESMERLRTIWGRYGYIYADIEPVIIPNFETNTVEMTFNSDLGKTYTLNRITILGNKKTCDYVIRRNLTLIEGQLVSLPAMEGSKDRIEKLGYFDPQGGVDWKIKKISQDMVDLDLVLKEIKTGNLNFQLSYGGADPQSPSTSIRLGMTATDRNLWGTGIRANLSGTFSQQDRLITLSLFEPWLFNKPLGGGVEFYHRSSFYEDFNNISTTPKENLTGGNLNLMFFIPGYPDVSTSIASGIERIQFQQGLRAEVSGRLPSQNELMQTFIDRRFASGTTSFVNIFLGQDVRNHPVFPNKGYFWSLVSRVGIPVGDSTFGYTKTDFDATWLTPLIGEYDLVFLLHGHAGIVGSLSNKIIPYRDLYNVGGPGTVRGFEFGQIGPQLFTSSIGAKKAFWINAELIFSITQDQSVRGLVFYDGGAGWDTPLSNFQKDLLQLATNRGALTNNAFRYRHSIGFGIRLLNPAPIRVDWAFKLDRNRRRGESFFEVHFSMNQEF